MRKYRFWLFLSVVLFLSGVAYWELNLRENDRAMLPERPPILSADSCSIDCVEQPRTKKTEVLQNHVGRKTPIRQHSLSVNDSLKKDVGSVAKASLQDCEPRVQRDSLYEGGYSVSISTDDWSLEIDRGRGDQVHHE
jgi:hypothetical protein